LGTNGTGWQEVMQFLSEGRYMANVVDGKLTLYERGTKNQGPLFPKSYGS